MFIQAGLVEEIIGDTLDSLEDDTIETEADLEVEKIITELTKESLSAATAAPTKTVPSKAKATSAPMTEEQPAAEENVDATTEDLMRRLQAL